MMLHLYYFNPIYMFYAYFVNNTWRKRKIMSGDRCFYVNISGERHYCTVIVLLADGNVSVKSDTGIYHTLSKSEIYRI